MKSNYHAHLFIQLGLLRNMLACVCAAMLLTGCAGTFDEVKPVQIGSPPVRQPSTLALGDLTMADSRVTPTEAELYRLKFRQGFENWLKTAHAPYSVVTPGAAPLPIDALTVSGNITEVEKGSSAARFWVGMGAGQARIWGDFEVRDTTGKLLTRFAARRSYLGGAGAGGWDMLSIDELMSRLGETVAESLTKWLRGEKIE